MNSEFITRASFTIIILPLTWILCIALYRLYFSPIANIPGPTLAALTSWYECYYDVIKPGQYVWKIKELHAQYGPIIRISPREIHVNDLDFLDNIYSSRQRNKDPEKVKALGNNHSTGGAVHYKLHHKRRESLDPFFSQKSVFDLESILQEKTKQLCGHFDRAVSQGTPINISDLYFAFALDVVWQYSFGMNENVLANPEAASLMRKNLTRLLRGVKFNLHFSWVRDTMKMIPSLLGKSFIPPGVMDLIRFRMKIRQNILEVLNDKDNARKTQARSIFYDLRDDKSLPAAEKTVSRLEDEGTLIVMAGTAGQLSTNSNDSTSTDSFATGTESTAKSISIAHYYLLSNPAVMKALRAELRTTSNPSLANLQQLPFLNSVILEANRLSFGLTGRNPRIAPSDTLHYHQYAIPPGTPVSTSTLCIHTDESVFPDPWSFRPDRWLNAENTERRKYMFAYGKGPRKCVGMNLAQAELCLTVAAMAEYDMELFETDERDVRFQHDYHVAHPRLDSKGIRATVLGKSEEPV